MPVLSLTANKSHRSAFKIYIDQSQALLPSLWSKLLPSLAWSCKAPLLDCPYFSLFNPTEAVSELQPQWSCWKCTSHAFTPPQHITMLCALRQKESGSVLPSPMPHYPWHTQPGTCALSASPGIISSYKACSFAVCPHIAFAGSRILILFKPNYYRKLSSYIICITGKPVKRKIQHLAVQNRSSNNFMLG